MAWHQRLVISGGIGSGKSAVRALLAEHGFRTIDADSVGHSVLMEDRPAHEEVAGRWPEVVVDGRIDRSALGAIVFSDERELQILESMTHPHIFGRITAQVEGFEGPVAVEIPLLHHSLEGRWTRLIVDSADDLRMKRLAEKGLSDQEARARMAAQPSRARWLAQADIVVPNQGSLAELEQAVSSLAAVV